MTSQQSLVTPAAFRIKELTLYISDNLDSARDKVSLASTCSYLFRLVVPQVWETVNGIEVLFALVPGVSIQKDTPSNNQPEKARQRLTIIMPRPPHCGDLPRFHMYCSFVKYLKVVNSRFAFDLQNGDTISSLANPGQMLLPNLLSLAFRASSTYHGKQVLWLSELFSPCLRSFRLVAVRRVEAGQALATPEDHSILLDLLAQRCTHLQELEVLVHVHSPGSQNSLDSNRRMWLEPPIRMSRIATLRSLTVSTLYIRAGGIEVFGTLPLLDTLTLCLLPPLRPEVIPDRLPEGAYPALLHLFLLEINIHATFSRIWKIFARAKKLMSLHVLYALPYFSQAQCEVVSILCREQSHIKDLRLYQSCGRIPPVTQPEAILTLAPLSALPLRTLCIGTSEKAPLDIDRLLGELQQTRFSSLVMLGISSIPLTFALLAAFAQSMPQLGYLKAQIDFSSINTIQLPDGSTPPSVFRTLLVDHWDEDMKVVATSLCSQWFSDDNAAKIASFFAALWPDVQIEINTRGAALDQKLQLELEEASRIAELLNRKISMLA